MLTRTGSKSDSDIALDSMLKVPITQNTKSILDPPTFSILCDVRNLLIYIDPVIGTGLG